MNDEQKETMSKVDQNESEHLWLSTLSSLPLLDEEPVPEALMQRVKAAVAREKIVAVKKKPFPFYRLIAPAAAAVMALAFLLPSLFKSPDRTPKKASVPAMMEADTGIPVPQPKEANMPETDAPKAFFEALPEDADVEALPEAADVEALPEDAEAKMARRPDQDEAAALSPSIADRAEKNEAAAAPKINDMPLMADAEKPDERRYALPDQTLLIVRVSAGGVAEDAKERDYDLMLLSPSEQEALEAMLSVTDKRDLATFEREMKSRGEKLEYFRAQNSKE